MEENEEQQKQSGQGNQVILRGFVNYLTPNNSYYKFSITLEAGRNRETNKYRKEYFQCQIYQSVFNENKFSDSCRIWLKGKLRREKGRDGNFYHFVDVTGTQTLSEPTDFSESQPQPQPQSQPQSQPQQNMESEYDYSQDDYSFV